MVKMKQNTKVIYPYGFLLLIFIVVSFFFFGLGYSQGMNNMAETGFEILEHIQVKEVNLDINETELMNTMFDRFQEEYDLNLTR